MILLVLGFRTDPEGSRAVRLPRPCLPSSKHRQYLMSRSSISFTMVPLLPLDFPNVYYQSVFYVYQQFLHVEHIVGIK
jgi:hypothetical protein